MNPTDRIADTHLNQLEEAPASIADTARLCRPQLDGTKVVHGIQTPVEILRDKWGVPHIYANSTNDLFFAQGFVAAQDRLFQMEMWRRSASGELAEILGEAYIESDRMARLMQYRGSMEAEWNSYGTETKSILKSFTCGLNEYIEACGENLPLEFQLLKFTPRKWKPEDCLLRQFSPRLTYNTSQELARAEMISRIGLEATMKFFPAEPHHIPTIDPEVDLQEISAGAPAALSALPVRTSPGTDGSNCWAIDGTLSATGKPLLASDPHRSMLLPALRYVCHLVAPGWNVIGAGEPHLPGIALGHNEHIAFGFTVAQFDQADLYVETLAPTDKESYRHGTDFIKMEVETVTIKVKGKAEPVKTRLKYTRHGPVVWESLESGHAIAIRWTGAEPGTTAYLGALEIDRAHDWKTFRQALQYWRMPAENLIYADVNNNIGWLAAGIAPIRKNWDGLLPVSGHNSQYEWGEFLSIDELPQEYNPSRHFVATANNNIVPPDYPHHIGYDWKSPYRIHRIREVLSRLENITVEDFKRLQHDEYSIPARQLIDLLMVANIAEPAGSEARELLTNWNCVLDSDSNAALLFEIWLTHLRALYIRTQADPVQQVIVDKYLELPILINLLQAMPLPSGSTLLHTALENAFVETANRFGPDKTQWRWGALHTINFLHPLANTAALKEALNIGKVECGGDHETVNATRGAGYTCEVGASHRLIIDLADWDRSLFINIPGQSGHPASPHYKDQLDFWRKKQYAPMLYSRSAIEQATIHRLTLVPQKPA